MANITFTIPDNKLARVKAGLLEVYPNTETDENGGPVYSDNEWLKERVRRFIVDSVKRGERAIAIHDACDALEEADSAVS